MNNHIRIIKSLTREEQELLSFSRPVGYHTRLQQYLEYPEALAKETMQRKGGIALSTTKTFRRCLLNYIRTFQPEALPTNSTLWLHLEKSGCFTVRMGKDGEIITGLNETDNYVFQYLCFLHIRCFWNYLQESFRFPAVKLPVLIQDFSDRLNENIDYEMLLQRAATIAALVVVL